MRAFLFALVVFPWMSLDLMGRLLVLKPALGALTLAAIAALAYAGLRLWKDPHISVVLRKFALAAGACLSVFFCAVLFFGLVYSAHIDWSDWQASGAGIQAGMTVAEARAAASGRAHCYDEGALEFTLRPKGLAALHFGFMDLYGVSLSTGADGRVAAVRQWGD